MLDACLLSRKPIFRFLEPTDPVWGVQFGAGLGFGMVQ